MEWGQGRYEYVAAQLLPTAEVMVDTAAIEEGERVVDVGCGTGNAALLAAERGARVTGIDPAQRLLDVAAAQAAERGLDARFELGEAASIPLPDDSADVVLSVFAAIFAPDPQAAAREMARVLAPGGRMLLSAWIPGGAVSQAVRRTRETVAEVLGQPPPTPPVAWHEEAVLRKLFEPYDLAVSLEEHSISFTAPSPEEFVDRESENHPLSVGARPAVEEAGRAEELRDGLVRIYRDANEDPSTFRVTSRYVVAEIEGSP
ncbi:MAG TPA: class I SAM-dependent methyltransferase [Solirubrobacterales bacterium]|nr:class I SAM-dependent methyltransferase [Solirubrobacterales bacterium]